MSCISKALAATAMAGSKPRHLRVARAAAVEAP